MHCRSSQLGKFLPVVIQVAVAVQRAAEAGALERFHVGVEVVLSEPVGKLLRSCEAVEELGVLWFVHERSADARVGSAFGGGAVHKHQHRPPDVRLELLLRHTRLLEVKHVEEVVLEHRLEHLRRWHRRPRQERHAERRDRAVAVRVKDGRVPGHRCAPIVADDHRRLLAQCIEDPEAGLGTTRLRGVDGDKWARRFAGARRRLTLLR